MIRDESRKQKEVVRKITELANREYGGDLVRMFDAYDKNGEGKGGSSELRELLKDAGIGSSLTRSIYARGIVSELDSDGDGEISKEEFKIGLSTFGKPKDATK